MGSLQQKIQLNPSWNEVLGAEFDKPYMQSLREFLRNRLAQKAIIFPQTHEVFAALNLIDIDQVKVVILGQDPYHGPGQAHGLCFSVRPGVNIPPSLVNIYKELKADLGIDPPKHGFLEEWARQGVLLLNSVLTVEAGLPASHQKRGWEQFTDRVIEILNERRQPLVFMLWGSYAQRKGAFINRSKHLVLETVHPSPLSAHRGFLGCRHFSQANDFLRKQNLGPINWALSPLPS